MADLKSKDKLNGQSTNFTLSSGVTFGYSVQLPVGKLFKIESALNFVQKGGKSSRTDSAILQSYKNKLTFNFFKLPLNLLFTPADNLKVFLLEVGQ